MYERGKNNPSDYTNLGKKRRTKRNISINVERSTGVNNRKKQKSENEMILMLISYGG